jgi:hypothetical protein
VAPYPGSGFGGGITGEDWEAKGHEKRKIKVMTLKSIHLEIPTIRPFDRPDWFEAFVGNCILPIVKTGHISSYWFSRYQDPNKHIRFRIKTENYTAIKPVIDGQITKYGLKDIGDETNYDGPEFRGRRFLAENEQQKDAFIRQELIWQFLSAATKLYVDTFSHADENGYWHREQSNDRANNIDGDIMESVHHLFCNLTAVQPRVELVMGLDHQGRIQTQLIAGHYRKWQGIPDELVRASQRVNF